MYAIRSYYVGPAPLALAGRLLVTHRLEHRRVVPDAVELLVEDVADHHRDKAAGGDVAVGAQVQGELAAAAPLDQRILLVTGERGDHRVIEGDVLV